MTSVLSILLPDLTRSRSFLADLVQSRARPRRILRLGDRAFDLAGRFPRAIVRDEAPTGWPDLVWCDHHFGGPDPEGAAAALRRELSPGTLLAVVESADRRVADALASAFPGIACIPVEGHWHTVAYVGKVPHRPLTLQDAGPLCEQWDAS